jgi:hypothetical protein
MPEEVFNLWLAPLIASDGWAFTSIFSSTYGTIWYRYFEGQSIEFFHNLFWHRKNIPCSFRSFHPSSRYVIELLINTHLKNIPTIAAQVKGGKGKEIFFGLRQFIKRTGRLPAPVILVWQSGGYHIMDGNHRISALFSLGIQDLLIDAWIGKP